MDDTEESPINKGNFKELLLYRINSAGDRKFEMQMKTASSRATYISKTTQNELISCCGEELLSIIISRIKKAQFYSAMFDETTDISHISQLTLVFRYLHENKIREDFVQYIDLFKEIMKLDSTDKSQDEIKATGYNLGQVVLKTIKKLTLDPNYCVSVSTDGCSVNVSDTCGAVKTVHAEAINSVYSPCFNHILNLSIGKSSSVESVRNVIGTMKEIISFFQISAKRNFTLKNELQHQLSDLCETRWVERHDGILQFRECLLKIFDILDIISKWSDSSISSKAMSLKSTICTSNFIVTVVCLSDVLSFTLPLSRFFQKKKIDLMAACDFLKDISKILDRKREKCEIKFAGLFQEICDIANDLDVTIKIPRLTNRQTKRANHPCENVEEYYRRSIYIPILDNVILDLKCRFPEETLKLYNLFILFPDQQIIEHVDSEQKKNNQ